MGTSLERVVAAPDQRRTRFAGTPKNSAVAVRPALTPSAVGIDGERVNAARVFQLQRTLGNHAVQRLIAGAATEEAVARQTLRQGDVRDANGVASNADAAVSRAESSSGNPLPLDLRRRFEDSLGASLSRVRVHTGPESAAAARAVSARAYTVGQDIHFGEGHFAPSDASGIHLLAHEVAHTVQNQGAAVQRTGAFDVSSPGDAAEVEAERAADAMVATSGATTVGHAGPAVGRVALSATPTAWLARADMVTNGGTFKVSGYSETDADPGNDTAKSVGASIKITFTPAETVTSDKISFVQIMKTLSGTTPYLFENEKARATDAKSTDAGWAVDRLAGRKSANYGQNNDGTAGSNTTFGHRKSKTDVVDATMTDGISLPRPKSTTFSSDATTYALDNTNSKYLGGIVWGFSTDAAGKVTKKANSIQSMGDPGGVQKTALEKWNEQAALADASKKNAADQAKVPVP